MWIGRSVSQQTILRQGNIPEFRHMTYQALHTGTKVCSAACRGEEILDVCQERRTRGYIKECK